MLDEAKLKIIRRELKGAHNRLPAVFSALGDPVRFKVFTLLMRHKNLCVSDIASVLSVSVPAASYQLKALEIVGLVRRERTGKTVCYIVLEDDPVVQSVMRLTQSRK